MRRFATRVDFSSITRSSVGRIGDSDFRLFFSRDGRPMSPWHDLPIASLSRKDEWFPFVCEIPIGHTEKMEVKLSEKFNPIAQDIKNGKPRYLPIKPRFNYGMMPQTFEPPKKKCLVTGLFGDGDPIDMVDISQTTLRLGSIIPVKVLGSFCFVDGGEADWKIIVASNETDQLNNEILRVMYSFFENYKGPGSGNYIFGNNRLFSVTETMDILRHAHENYQDLLNSHRTTRSGGESDEEEPVHVWVPGNGRT
jgi:inorganic pyrophosphatase